MKKFSLIVLFTMFPIAINAQEINLKVTNPELGLIGKGLGTLPFNDVAPLMQKLQTQVIEQQKKDEPKPVDKEPKK